MKKLNVAIIGYGRSGCDIHSAFFRSQNNVQQIRESGFGRENVPAMMAAVVVISLPLIVLFLIFRKKIMAGVARGGTKG